MSYKADKYQEAFIEYVKNGSGNAIVNAVAGAGKSSTIIEAIKSIPEEESTVLVSYNRSIAEENKSKIGEGHDNVLVSTIHSLGYKIIRERFNTEFKEEKYQIYIRKNVKSLSGVHVADFSKSKYGKYISNIIELTHYSRFNLCSKKREIGNIAERYGTMLVADECAVVEKVLEWGRGHVEEIDYTDMIWLPVVLKLKTEQFCYKNIFIDEAQDTTPMAQALVDILKKEGSRFFAVGDEDQCINAWAGADKDAFNSFLKYSDTERFEMPVSYRCPKKIVEYVQPLVPQIIPTENAIEGEIRFNTSIKDIASGDLILCRNLLPLVMCQGQLLNQNKKVVMEGQADIMKELIRMVEDTEQEALSINLTEDGVFPRLYKSLFQEIDLYKETTGANDHEAIFSDRIVSFYEKIRVLEIITQALTQKEDLINKMRDIFGNPSNEGIRLSTIHKAKGIEADNVHILGRSLMPSPLAKKDWQLEEEKNLEYVAYTRTKKTLNFISEEEFPVDNIHMRQDSLIKELSEKRMFVESCINNGRIQKKASSVRNAQPKKPEGQKIATRKIGGNKFNMFD